MTQPMPPDTFFLEADKVLQLIGEVFVLNEVPRDIAITALLNAFLAMAEGLGIPEDKLKEFYKLVQSMLENTDLAFGIKPMDNHHE